MKKWTAVGGRSFVWCLVALGLAGCAQEFAFRREFRNIRLGELPPWTQSTRWYAGSDGESHVIHWVADAQGKVDRKFLLRFEPVGVGSPAFSGKPDVLTARETFLMLLPTTLACEFEGFARGGPDLPALWEKHPADFLASLFPRGEVVFEHFTPPGSCRRETWLGDLREEKGKYKAEFLVCEDSPSAGFWAQVTPLPGGWVHVRGFAFGFWPGNTTVGDNHISLRESGMTNLLGWVWLQAEWRRCGGTDLSWEEYRCIRDGFKSFESWYCNLLLKTEAAARDSAEEPYIADRVRFWRSLRKTVSHALEE